MTRIVQIAPEIRAGSGVEGVAFQLEEQFRLTGVETERFTLREAGGAWIRLPERELARKAAVALRVVWFSTVGTIRARQFLALRPDAVAICHNDVLAGEIYVNHGILRAAMRARGRYAWRMMRNPLHLFTSMRDWVRYGSGIHRVVVNLTEAERALLVGTYPRLRPRTVVIPNGVDLGRFRPPLPGEKVAARARLSVDEGQTVAIFVGHEFERKGLPIAMEALRDAPDVVLVVVGRSPDMIADATGQAARIGIADRVRFLGRQSDPLSFLHAGDVLVLPSAYEANALVVLEALACGLPVISTRVGFAPDIIEDGRNGFLVERCAADVARGLAAVARADRDELQLTARRTAERYSWQHVAQRYLDLIGEIEREKGVR